MAEDSNDWAPPQIVGDIVITPDKPGKQGQEFKLIFAVNEPLAERDENGGFNPWVSIDIGAQSPSNFLLENKEASDEPGIDAVYTFKYTTTGNEAEGVPASINIVLKDLVFNEGGQMYNHLSISIFKLRNLKTHRYCRVPI